MIMKISNTEISHIYETQICHRFEKIVEESPLLFEIKARK